MAWSGTRRGAPTGAGPDGPPSRGRDGPGRRPSRGRGSGGDGSGGDGSGGDGSAGDGVRGANANAPAGRSPAGTVPRAMLARSILREVLRRMERIAGTPFSITLSVPERIIVAPPDILVGEGVQAEDIYGGRFDLAGHVVETHGASPFAVTNAPLAWLRALHGFGWLRHESARGDALAHAHARALAGDWFRERGGPDRSLAWDPMVASARLRHWLAYAPVLLSPDAGADEPDGAPGRGPLADPGFDDRFLRQIAVHRRQLRRMAREERDPLVRLHVVATLAIASLALPTGREEQRRLGEMLDAELRAQVLHDGGHASRRAGALVDLLTVLLPLERCYVARGLVAPPGLLPAIDRMMPALRHHVMGDGGLARHNGTFGVRRDRLSAILALDGAGRDAATGLGPPGVAPALGLGSAAGAGAVRGVDTGGAPLELPDSGYERLAIGDTILVVDTGTPPPHEHAALAHAGALSFEMSVGDAPLVVNLGATEPGEPGGDDLMRALRSTAAHSTLSLDGIASAHIVSGATARRLFGEAMVDGPTAIELRRADAGDGTWRGFRAVHDGYRRAGILHERVLMLRRGGARLEGTDRMLPAGGAGTATGKGAHAPGRAATVRFHLHPAVRARPDGRGIALEVGGEVGSQAWRFEADIAATLEETLFCDGRPTPSAQIVLALGGDRRGVEWTFYRVDPTADEQAADEQAADERAEDAQAEDARDDAGPTDDQPTHASDGADARASAGDAATGGSGENGSGPDRGG